MFGLNNPNNPNNPNKTKNNFSKKKAKKVYCAEKTIYQQKYKYVQLLTYIILYN